jgi:guanylate kinase
LADPDLQGRLHLSVSATTRAPRPGEAEGVHYHFWTPERFEREVAAGAFLEWANVHGHCYGTLVLEVEPYRERGLGVILDIDVQGAASIGRRYSDLITIFLRAQSLETYELRLRQRGTETEASIARRLAGARRELALAADYRYQIINEDLDAAVAALREIVLHHLNEGDPCSMN